MTQRTTVDETKLNQFIGQMLGDLGGASSIAMVRATHWASTRHCMPRVR